MKWRLGFLALALFSALVLVIVSQNETITEQRAMIRSFYDDPVCMHDPRVTH
jgi:hypothetical protein